MAHAIILEINLAQIRKDERGEREREGEKKLPLLGQVNDFLVFIEKTMCLLGGPGWLIAGGF